MDICDKLSRNLSMFTYIYHNADDCWLTSSMPQQMPKLQLLLNYSCNSRKCHFWRLVVALKAVEVNWFRFTYMLDNSIQTSIHAWLIKDYRSSGMIISMTVLLSFSDVDIILFLVSFMLYFGVTQGVGVHRQIFGRVVQHTMKKWTQSDLWFCKNEGSKGSKSKRGPRRSNIKETFRTNDSKLSNDIFWWNIRPSLGLIFFGTKWNGDEMIYFLKNEGWMGSCWTIKWGLDVVGKSHKFG